MTQKPPAAGNTFVFVWSEDAVGKFAERVCVSAQRFQLVTELSEKELQLLQAILRKALTETSEEVATQLVLPDTAPALYEARENKAESALDFLRRVWGPYIKAGLLHQFQLQTRDGALLKAVRNYCGKRGIDVAMVIPTRSHFVEKREKLVLEHLP